jgi:hypothetical protein
MKQKDVALLIIVAFISAVISFFVSGLLFGTPDKRDQDVEKVQAISSSLEQPDERYFNEQAFDPTKPITIGPNANQAPFNTTTTEE